MPEEIVHVGSGSRLLYVTVWKELRVVTGHKGWPSFGAKVELAWLWVWQCEMTM
jgi:hypothetical protein